jgi:hypothetical protein
MCNLLQAHLGELASREGVGDWRRLRARCSGESWTDPGRPRVRLGPSVNEEGALPAVGELSAEGAAMSHRELFCEGV